MEQKEMEYEYPEFTECEKESFKRSIDRFKQSLLIDDREGVLIEIDFKNKKVIDTSC